MQAVLMGQLVLQALGAHSCRGASLEPCGMYLPREIRGTAV